MKKLYIYGKCYSFRDLKENEEYREDGIYCTVCGEQKAGVIEDNVLEGVCQCYYNQVKKQKELEEIARRIYRQNELKRQSLLHDRYANVSFNNSQYIPQHKKLIEYCNNSKENYKLGTSIYLYGNYGTGKTHAMACIANELMSKLYSVHFTNFNNIVRDIKSTYKPRSARTEQDIFDLLTDIDFLFIDDIGTEYLKDVDGFVQALIYDVINTRYNKYKPCIFSSNYSILDLCGLSNIEERTGQRIYEMSKGNVIEFKGRNFRV